MQVTVQNASGGSGRSIASSASGVASMPPGTPKTRLIRSGAGITPCSSQRTALMTWPTSKTSTSSAIPCSSARAAIPRPAGGGVMKVSSPKFIEPDSTPEMSGDASSPVVRSSIVMSLLPPVDTIVRRSGAPARIRSMTSTKSSGRPLGVPSSSRTCRWAMAAPAAAASIAESATSFVVYGMFGLFSRNTSAPVMAQVTTTGSESQELKRAPPLICG